ncbi:hypothetical protein [Fluviicoccus keumensis]|nr:hypothetical protein [Fluviicoccus keumensis]
MLSSVLCRQPVSLTRLARIMVLVYMGWILLTVAVSLLGSNDRQHVTMTAQELVILTHHHAKDAGCQSSDSASVACGGEHHHAEVSLKLDTAGSALYLVLLAAAMVLTQLPYPRQLSSSLLNRCNRINPHAPLRHYASYQISTLKLLV